MIDWNSVGADSADNFAAEIVCRWYECVEFNPIVDGVDYSILIRQHLWPLVASQIRTQQGRVESLSLASIGNTTRPGSTSSTLRRSLLYASRTKFWLKQIYGNFRISPGRHLFVPFPHARWDKVWAAIRQTDLRVATESPIRFAVGSRLFTNTDIEFAVEIVTWLRKALAKWSLCLLQSDFEFLVLCVARSRHILRFSAVSLRRTHVRLLIVNSSATSPTIEYVLSAKHIGIPSCAIQYGLDCDRLVYDDLHADCAAVWSERRMEQYNICFSGRRKEITVTGNPEYDSSFMSHCSSNRSIWLWLTRPHTPGKCKLPSSDPEEGLHILRAFIEALNSQVDAKLIIKPHPSDYVALYTALIADQGMQHRITISSLSVNSVIQEAGVVITEDTTAGLDALFFQPPCIHVRFSSGRRVLPFGEYGAAIPASSHEELIRALEIVRGDHVTRDQLDGQRAFIRTYAGPTDGRSQNRLSAYLHLDKHTSSCFQVG